MFPFRNILFPTDFTPHARAALKYAAAFARSGGGRVVLFRKKGIENAAALLGGMDAWKNAGLPVDKGQ
jgi:rhodanese-related sulfurtransferase